jgi:hypothetical protein
MSRLLQNLHRAGVSIDTRRNFRGGRGDPVQVITTFRWEFPLQTFLTAIQRKEAKVLYRTGRALLRSYKKVLGKSYPKERTPKGKRSARFIREIARGNRHPHPYMKTGILRNATEFFVDQDAGTTVAGPIRLSGHGWGSRVRASKPVPQLLEEGGPATVLTARRTKTVRHARKVHVKQTGGQMIKVTYRSFAYKHVPKEQGIKVMRDGLDRIPL